jgi:hypothetical protein
MVVPGFLDETDPGPDNVGIAPQPFVFDHERWVRLRRQQLGIDVIDPLGHQIGPAAAMNFRWEGRQANWFPVDGMKHVLVGELDHYYSYNGDGHEMDWNLCLAPDPAFRSILDRVARDMSADQREEHLVERRHGPGYCVECEITPDEGLWFNDFFPHGGQLLGLNQSTLLGQKLGVYGPWVRDKGHGRRPEIHPCEVIWWMAAANPLGVSASRLVLVVQDDSSRFDRPSDYDGPVPRPWSAFPRRASIAVTLRPRVEDHMHFNLRLLYAREMADMADPGAASVTREFGGRPVITVTKRIEQPAKIRMRLGPVAPDPDGVHLRCFLYLGVQVGSGDQGQEGYALLNLETMTPHAGPHRDPAVPPGGQEP